MIGIVRELIAGTETSCIEYAGAILEVGFPLQLAFISVLGRGSFGTVYRATSEKFPNCAVKVVRGCPHRLRDEVDVMKSIGRNHRISILEFAAFSSDGAIAVIGMELCVPLTLHDFLVSHSLLSIRDLLFVAHQIVAAVACVHNAGCVHRDIKLQNFVFDPVGNLKLIDFGLSAPSLMPDPGDVVAGTVSFMAPEMARNALNPTERVSVGVQADIWSTGIVLFTLFTRQAPYFRDSEGEYPGTKQLLPLVASGSWSWPIGIEVDPQMKSLIESLLQHRPEKRTPLGDLLKRSIWTKRGREPPFEISAFVGATGAMNACVSVTPLKPRDKNIKEFILSTAAESFLAVRSSEERARRFLQSVLALQREELCEFVRLEVEEDQERYTVQWLAENQLLYAKHPHHFKTVKKLPRGYENGIICDGCSKEVEAEASRSIQFSHCSCGMDLCVDCARAYDAKYTCACGKVLSNRSALIEHRRMTGCLKRKRDDRICLSDVKLENIRTWNAFSSLNAEAAREMTPEEVSFVLRGEWVRRFRFLHESSEAQDPIAFAYTVQPGRTAALFLQSGAKLHSAVLSGFEGKVFCVEELEFGQDGQRDICCLLSWNDARRTLPSEFHLLQKIAVEDANMLKMQRAPGTLSVYQNPEKNSIRCFGDDYIFVRWLKVDPSSNVVAVSLSNGCVQVFGPAFELRWKDDRRKFFVQGNGQCGVIDEQTFCHINVVKKLLDEPLL